RDAEVHSTPEYCTITVPVHEVARLAKENGFAAELNPITRVVLLQVRNDLAFADKNVRLAAHHAIDKAALSKAFYGGAAVPLSVVATAGTAACLPGFKFECSPDTAKAALAKSSFWPEK